jgi:hypothetical protein
MADRLEGSMQRFLDNQLNTVPRELTVAQVLDLPALQQSLQQTLQESFEQQYLPVDAKIKREIEEMGKTAERKVVEIRALQEGKLRELDELKGKMRESQQNQDQFVGEIERIVGEKGFGIAQSHNQAREEIRQMHEKIAECSQIARNLFSEIERKQFKAEIRGEIEVGGGDQVTFNVNNRKIYCLEDCVLRFLGPDGNPYYSGVIEPVVPGYQQANVSAQLPADLAPNNIYQVAIWKNETVISRSVPFLA